MKLLDICLQNLYLEKLDLQPRLLLHLVLYNLIICSKIRVYINSDGIELWTCSAKTMGPLC